ncbi:hypothetical protein [Nonomuraea glycinis]|uniref:hypothetical protein n=1 Tax=Nonomuraea glycinis TaxID=2047744 RepID=UPI0033A4DB58
MKQILREQQGMEALACCRRLLEPALREIVCRSQVAFILGVRGSVVTIHSPVMRSPGSITRLRACCTVHAPAGCAVTPARCSFRVPCSMKISTCVQPFEQNRFDRQEVTGNDRVGLSGQEVPPARAGSV